MVGNARKFERFSLRGAIPTAVNLTTHADGSDGFIATPLQQVIAAVEAGRFRPPISCVFRVGEIVEAHQTMEGNVADGKIVASI